MGSVEIGFAVTRWDQEPVDDGGDGPPLARAAVGKAFTGPLEGTGVAILLLSQTEEGAGYSAMERISGSLEGRSGTFVVHHGGIMAGGEPTAHWGHIVPGSGTGELAGITGTIAFRHTDAEAVITLDYEIG